MNATQHTQGIQSCLSEKSVSSSRRARHSAAQQALTRSGGPCAARSARSADSGGCAAACSFHIWRSTCVWRRQRAAPSGTGVLHGRLPAYQYLPPCASALAAREPPHSSSQQRPPEDPPMAPAAFGLLDQAGPRCRCRRRLHVGLPALGDAPRIHVHTGQIAWKEHKATRRSSAGGKGSAERPQAAGGSGVSTLTEER